MIGPPIMKGMETFALPMPTATVLPEAPMLTPQAEFARFAHAFQMALGKLSEGATALGGAASAGESEVPLPAGGGVVSGPLSAGPHQPGLCPAIAGKPTVTTSPATSNGDVPLLLDEAAVDVGGHGLLAVPGQMSPEDRLADQVIHGPAGCIERSESLVEGDRSMQPVTNEGAPLPMEASADIAVAMAEAAPRASLPAEHFSVDRGQEPGRSGSISVFPPRASLLGRVAGAEDTSVQVSVGPLPSETPDRGSLGARPAPLSVESAVTSPVAASPDLPRREVRAGTAETSVRISVNEPVAEKLGVAIARRAGEGGDEVIVRMDPAELGRIHVRLSFSESGSLRALVGADSQQVLDLLRRDSAELGRVLADAGVRTDSQSFRFDRGNGSAGEGAAHQWAGAQGEFAHQDEGEMSEPLLPYRPLSRSGRVDLIA